MAESFYKDLLVFKMEQNTTNFTETAADKSAASEDITLSNSDDSDECDSSIDTDLSDDGESVSDTSDTDTEDSEDEDSQETKVELTETEDGAAGDKGMEGDEGTNLNERSLEASTKFRERLISTPDTSSEDTEAKNPGGLPKKKVLRKKIYKFDKEKRKAVKIVKFKNCKEFKIFHLNLRHEDKIAYYYLSLLKNNPQLLKEAALKCKIALKLHKVSCKTRNKKKEYLYEKIIDKFRKLLAEKCPPETFEKPKKKSHKDQTAKLLKPLNKDFNQECIEALNEKSADKTSNLLGFSIPQKPEYKSYSNPEYKTSKPENKSSSKPEYKTSKPENKSSSKPENKSYNKPEYKTSNKPVNKSYNKPEYKTTSKPEYKTTSKPEYKTTSKPEYKTTSKPEYKTTSKSEYKTTSKPEYKTPTIPQLKTIDRPKDKTKKPVANTEQVGKTITVEDKKTARDSFFKPTTYCRFKDYVVRENAKFEKKNISDIANGVMESFDKNPSVENIKKSKPLFHQEDISKYLVKSAVQVQKKNESGQSSKHPSNYEIDNNSAGKDDKKPHSFGPVGSKKKSANSAQTENTKTNQQKIPDMKRKLEEKAGSGGKKLKADGGQNPSLQSSGKQNGSSLSSKPSSASSNSVPVEPGKNLGVKDCGDAQFSDKLQRGQESPSSTSKGRCSSEENVCVQPRISIPKPLAKSLGVDKS